MSRLWLQCCWPVEGAHATEEVVEKSVTTWRSPRQTAEKRGKSRQRREPTADNSMGALKVQMGLIGGKRYFICCSQINETTAKVGEGWHKALFVVPLGDASLEIGSK